MYEFFFPTLCKENVENLLRVQPIWVEITTSITAGIGIYKLKIHEVSASVYFGYSSSEEHLV